VKFSDLEDFRAQYIYFTDRVLPSLPPSEQALLNHIFSRSIAEGREIVRLSLEDMKALTAIKTTNSIRKALAGLKERNLISVASNQTRKTAKGYRIIIPSEEATEHKLAKASTIVRDPVAVSQTMDGITQAESTEVGIVDKLSVEDREALETIIKTLSGSELERMQRAARRGMKPGDNFDKRLREVVVMTRFGRDRLSKYQQTAEENDNGS
jgi:hypothetical protein